MSGRNCTSKFLSHSLWYQIDCKQRHTGYPSPSVDHGLHRKGWTGATEEEVIPFLRKRVVLIISNVQILLPRNLESWDRRRIQHGRCDEPERDRFSLSEGTSTGKSRPEDKEEDDPSLAEWFKIDDKVPDSQDDREGDTDSETDPESDEDTTPIEDINPEKLDDDCFQVASADESANSKSLAHSKTPHPTAPTQQSADKATGEHVEQVSSEARMGDDNDAMAYDPDVIFKHLCVLLEYTIFTNLTLCSAAFISTLPTMHGSTAWQYAPSMRTIWTEGAP